MPEITTDHVLRFFIEAERPVQVSEVAARFGIQARHASRLVRRLVLLEQRATCTQVSSNKYWYEPAQPKAGTDPMPDRFTGWGNAPRLGLK